MNAVEIELRARLLAQSYLLEIALGSLLAGQADPNHLIDKMRFDLEAQLRSDHLPGGPAFPSADAEARVVHCATDHLRQMLDRVASQLETPPHPPHHA